MALYNSLNKVLKINIDKFVNNEIAFPADKSDKNYKRDKIDNFKVLIRESELIRIIKHLNPENRILDKGYPFVKDIVIVHIGDKTNIYQDTIGKIKVQGVEYTRLLASTGSIRNTKIVFVRSDLYDKVNEILLCGLAKDMEYDIFAKFSAYYALCQTDSLPVKMPKIVVIDDYVTNIVGEKFDIVTEIGKDEYKVDNNVECSLLGIKPFDGAGLVDLSLAREWSFISLNLNYIPSAFQFRFIPCGKGNLYTCDFKRFAKENNIVKITDVWETKHDLFDENGELLINVILTKSQFKFVKLYSSFSDWLKLFEENLHGYPRTFNISKISDNPKHIKNETVLSYQPFQSLNLNSEEIKLLCNKTEKLIKDISLDIDEFLKYRGIADYIDEDTGEIIESDNDNIPPYYEVMKTHKNLWYDTWIQEKVNKDIKGFKDRACKGMIFLEANYQTLIPDIIALAQYAFDLKVTGALKANEVYNRYWHNTGKGKIGIVRFPHIAMEWKVSKVVDVPHYMFDQISEGTVCSIFDSMALKLNSADFDGDKVVNVTGLCVDIAERQMNNTIIFEPLSKNEDVVTTHKINDMAHLIETDITGMSNNIGAVVNLITILWSLVDTACDADEKNRIMDYIKIMSIVGSLTIDFVKTGIKAQIPKEIEAFIRSKKAKLPHFMKYRYPKKLTKDKNKNRNQRIKNQIETSSFSGIDCTMNRICSHMEKSIANIEKSIKDEISKNNNNEFVWSLMMSDPSRNFNNATYPKVVNMLTELKQEYNVISKQRLYCDTSDKVNDNSSRFRIFYTYCKNILLSICNDKDIDKLLDYIVYAMYMDKKYKAHNDDKSILWNCFGDEILKRVSNGRLKISFDDYKLMQKWRKAEEKLSKYIASDKEVNVVVSTEKDIKPENEKEKKFKSTVVKIDVRNTEITFTQGDIDFVRKQKREVRQLVFVLLGLYKMFSLHGCSFKIVNGRKNKITPSHVIRLSDIDGRYYEEFMNKLWEEGVYTSNKGAKEFLIKFDDKIPTGHNLFIINDINDFEKYYKKYANSIDKTLKIS